MSTLRHAAFLNLIFLYHQESNMPETWSLRTIQGWAPKECLSCWLWLQIVLLVYSLESLPHSSIFWSLKRAVPVIICFAFPIILLPKLKYSIPKWTKISLKTSALISSLSSFVERSPWQLVTASQPNPETAAGCMSTNIITQKHKEFLFMKSNFLSRRLHYKHSFRFH